MPRTQPIRVYLEDSYFSAYPSSIDRIIADDLPASLFDLKIKIRRHDPTVDTDEITTVTEAIIILAHLGERTAPPYPEEGR